MAGQKVVKSGSPVPLVAALAVAAGAVFTLLRVFRKGSGKKEGNGQDLATRDRSGAHGNVLLDLASPASEFHDASQELAEESPRGTPVKLGDRFGAKTSATVAPLTEKALANGKAEEEFLEAETEEADDEEDSEEKDKVDALFARAKGLNQRLDQLLAKNTSRT